MLKFEFVPSVDSLWANSILKFQSLNRLLFLNGIATMLWIRIDSLSQLQWIPSSSVLFDSALISYLLLWAPFSYPQCTVTAWEVVIKYINVGEAMQQWRRSSGLIHLKSVLIKKALSKKPSTINPLKIKSIHVFTLAKGVSLLVILFKARWLCDCKQRIVDEVRWTNVYRRSCLPIFGGLS